MSLQSKTHKIQCLVRSIWVAATPEEKLRQRILSFMLGKGGYPKGSTAVEVLIGQDNNARRADIVVYAKSDKKGLAPFFVVECKAVKLTPVMIQQIGGYNYFFEAPFIALANTQESYWGWMDTQTKAYRLEWGFPTYEELVKLSNSPSS